MLVKVSLVASAHDSGEGGAVGSAEPGGQVSPSPGCSLMGEISTPTTGDLVGREKFSTDLDSLMLGVVAGVGPSFGGGSGRGGVIGRSGMIEEVGDGSGGASA